jgi:hypothetical protein
MGRPGILLLTFVLQLSAALQAFAQSPASNSPVLHYTLRIDSSDLSGYTVSIRVYPAPHRFRLAMATHHEYDDRFWKNIRSFQVDAPASYIREDSAVWVITTPGDEAQVTYRIQLPPSAPLHFSHRPFLSRNGGLVGDLHSFMYLVEDPHALCRLTLQLPTGWQAATGLDPMSATAPQLLDAPILVGRLYRWDFTVDGIPHEVAWLSGTDTTYFDTVALVANIQKIVRTTAAIFGSFPPIAITAFFSKTTAQVRWSMAIPSRSACRQTSSHREGQVFMKRSPMNSFIPGISCISGLPATPS